MEKLIAVKRDYASLERLEVFLRKETYFVVSQEYDSWEIRTDENGQMKKCIVLKKSNMHGLRMYFEKENTLKINYLIPNKLMNAFFGKNQQKYQSIMEIITGKIKEMFLSSSQKSAFNEMVEVFNKIAI